MEHRIYFVGAPQKLGKIHLGMTRKRFTLGFNAHGARELQVLADIAPTVDRTLYLVNKQSITTRLCTSLDVLVVGYDPGVLLVPYNTVCHATPEYSRNTVVVERHSSVSYFGAYWICAEQLHSA